MSGKVSTVPPSQRAIIFRAASASEEIPIHPAFSDSFGLGFSSYLRFRGEVRSRLTITDYAIKKLSGLTGITGGAGNLDGVSIAPYAEGDLVSFTIDDTSFIFEVRDEDELPVEDGYSILPDTPSGTKYWSLHYAFNAQPGNGETFLSFGNSEVSARSFDGGSISSSPGPLAQGGMLTSSGQYSLNLTPTWNAGSNTMTGIRMRVSDTASNANSLLIDLGTNASKFSVDKNGNLSAITAAGRSLIANGTAGAGYVELAPQLGADVPVATDKIRLWQAADTFFISYDDNAPGGVDSPRIGFKSAVNGIRYYRFPAKGNGTDTILLESDPDLVALANNSSNGLWAHISAGSGSARTLIAGSSKISITNGDGVAGNPTFDLVEANLTFTDSTPIVNGSGDATKRLRFEVDGFTTGATRVVTFPNADCTVARTDAANSFTGLQTFNTGITASGSGNIDIKSSNSFSVGGSGSANATLTSANSTTVETTGSGSVIFNTGGSNRFNLNSSGNLVPNADNARNIGGAGAAMVEVFTRGVDSGSANDLVLQRNNVNGLTLAAAANISALPVRLKGYTVAGLPAGTQGDLAFVTDANAPTYNATVAGGGAFVIPVFYNGTNWVCH